MANTPIVHDNRTEAEKRYDAERDGTLYLKPQPALTEAEAAQQAMRIELAREADRILAEKQAEGPWGPILDIIADPTNDGREHADTPLSDTEEKIINTLYGPVRVVRSRGEAHRQERWNAILEKVAAMDEPEKSEMIGYMAGLLDGMSMRRKPAA